jgi:HPt (histidine-containing phosphotransfer) domain-containing protein
MIDTKKFTDTKELMGESFDDFLQLFFTELESDIQTIATTDDMQTIHLKAHSQKSSCRLVGATALSDLFLQIEQLAKQNERVDNLIAQLPDLLNQTKTTVYTL